MRLDKYLAQSTDLSRTQAKQQLKKKQITVNDCVITDASYNVAYSDTVCFRDTRLSWPGPRYLMLNKPQGFECSHQPSAHRSVFSLVQVPNVNALQVVGRLDQDTTGLVLLTDDGPWLHALTSPKKAKSKRYLVSCAEPISDTQLQRLRHGVTLKDDPTPTLPATAVLLSQHQLQLEIKEGRYHQIKRMMAAVGNAVVGLHRESIAHIELDASLKEGEWRWLNPDEIILK